VGISDRVTPYRLTILGLIVTLVLPVAVLIGFGRDPRDYVAFVGPALAVVLAVFKAEQNSQQVKLNQEQTAANHDENQQLLGKLVYDNEAFRKALQELQKPESTAADAAKVAVDEMPPPPPATPAPVSTEGT
jgi:hypothetical protein